MSDASAAASGSALQQARRAARERGDVTLLQQIVPYAAFLGVQLQSAEPPRFAMPFRDDLVGNPRLPAIHGGVIAGFAECAAQLQLLLALDERRVPKSIDFSIDYLRSAGPRTTLAACEVARQGVRVALVTVRVWQQDEHVPIALARCHFLLSGSDAGG